METKYFDRPEGRIAYSDYNGDGQPVLMLSGMGALRSEYRYLAPKLSQAGYRAITIDLRGHGESSVPWQVYDVPSVGNDILGLIDHLGAGAAHLIGTSFSAAPIVWAAVEYPDCVRSLTLIGAFARNVKINPVIHALFWIMVHNPWRVRMWTTYYGRLYPTQKPSDFKEYLTNLGNNLAEPGRFDAAIALSSSSRQPSEERLGKVNVPTLVIMGTKDPDFPDPVAEGKVLAELTGGDLELVEGGGHYPQTELSEKTSAIILGFLSGVKSS